jgi:2',3'-cyclic-nucleotide 2'-phosphodiesterase/3'-nucleotidase
LRAREHPDLVLVAAHSGLGRDLDTGRPHDPEENVVYDVATQVPQLDAIVFGHSHQELAGRLIGNVLVVQPKNWAISLGQIDFTLERNAGGPWKLISKKSRLIPVTAQTAPAAISPRSLVHHEAAERYLNTPVATSSASLSMACRGAFRGHPRPRFHPTSDFLCESRCLVCVRVQSLRAVLQGGGAMR